MKRIFNWLIERWKITVPAGVILVAVGAWLFFGFFGFHTLFFDEKVNEAVPVFSSGAGPSGLESDFTTEEMADEMNDAMQDEETPEVAETDEAMPMDDAPELTTLVEGTFIDRSHPARGLAKVITDGSEQRFLRFEDFIDLGDLKGNVGPQNYELAPDVDLDRYRTVVIWCVRFSVAFGAAELMPVG